MQIRPNHFKPALPYCVTKLIIEIGFSCQIPIVFWKLQNVNSLRLSVLLRNKAAAISYHVTTPIPRVVPKHQRTPGGQTASIKNMILYILANRKPARSPVLKFIAYKTYVTHKYFPYVLSVYFSEAWSACIFILTVHKLRV